MPKAQKSLSFDRSTAMAISHACTTSNGRKAVERSQVSIKVATFFLSETGVKRAEAGLSSVESPLNRFEGNTYNPPKRNPSRDSF